MQSDKLIYSVFRKENNIHEFYHHKIRGDGNCFLNCYLDSFSSKYRELAYSELGTKIGSKMRLEFAKFLISPSSRSENDICLRLNIKNAGIIFSHLLRDKNGHPCNLKRNKLGEAILDENGEIINVIDNITNSYIDFDSESTSEIIARILELDLLIFDSEKHFEEWEKLTDDYLINLLLKDPRYNYYENTKIINGGSLSQDHILEDLRINEKDFGISEFPINIGYYEITEQILSDISMFKETLDILINCEYNPDYLQHEQSTLFALFIGLNVKYLPLGDHHPCIGQFGKKKRGIPTMILLNLYNVHWEILIIKNNSDIGGRVFNINDKTINLIYQNFLKINQR